MSLLAKVGASLQSRISDVMQRTAFVMLVAALPFLVLWPTTASLARVWNDPLRVELSHGFLTALIALWLIWHRRNEIAQVPLRPNPLALLALAVLSVVWLVLVRSSIQVGHQLLLPIVSVITLFAVCGRQIAALTLFPLGYLFLAMPIWTVLNVPLQWGSVLAVRLMLRITGIPAYFSGAKFELPSGVFEIADGCSGLRLLLVGLAIAILYGELQRASIARRVLLVAIAAVLSAFANWLRIYIILLAGHFYGIDHALVTDHIWLGWVVFACVMVAFFWLANRILPQEVSDPVTALSPQDRGVWPVRCKQLVAAGIVLALGPLWSFAQVALDRFDAPVTFTAPTLAGWRQEVALSDWRPAFVGADWEVRVSYLPVTPGTGIELYSAGYRDQRQGKELMGFGNSILGPRDHIQSRVLTSKMELQSGMPRIVTIAQAYDGRWLYWHSYAVGQSWFANSLRTQLHYAIRSLWRIPESRVLILRTRCADDTCVSASENLQSLWQMMVSPRHSIAVDTVRSP